MSYLNISIPEFQCLLKKEYLYNLQEGQGEFEECLVFGAASIPGRATLFHCLLRNGAQIGRLPISAFVWKKEAPDIPLDHLQIWDSFSYRMSCTEYDWLSGLRVSCLLKSKKWEKGEYIFTLDWFDSQDSENCGDIGWKCAHLLQLDNGLYALQPNNRMRWHEVSFCVEPFPERPDYKTMDHLFSCEDGDKWVTEDSDRMFHAYQDKEDFKAVMKHVKRESPASCLTLKK